MNELQIIENFLFEYFKEFDRYYHINAMYPTTTNDMIIVETSIDWGDWKHDHRFYSYEIEKLGGHFYSDRVTETDGSDTYSAIYRHTFKKKDLLELINKKEKES